jgi:hypothetical protein
VISLSFVSDVCQSQVAKEEPFRWQNLDNNGSAGRGASRDQRVCRAAGEPLARLQVATGAASGAGGQCGAVGTDARDGQAAVP